MFIVRNVLKKKETTDRSIKTKTIKINVYLFSIFYQNIYNNIVSKKSLYLRKKM